MKKNLQYLEAKFKDLQVKVAQQEEEKNMANFKLTCLTEENKKLEEELSHHNEEF